MKYTLDGKEFDNQRDYRKALKESEDRNNAHEIWSTQDDSALLKLSETKSISELADHFKRTELAIIHRLEKLVPSYEIQTEFHANGLKKNEGLYFVGNLYSNGIRKKEGLYFLRSLHGEHFLRYLTEWFENGLIKSQGNYIEYADTPHGKKTEWYESGQIKSEGNYETIEESQMNPAVIKVGKWSSWYENSQIKSEGSFYNCWGTENEIGYGDGPRLHQWSLEHIQHYEIDCVGDDDDDEPMFGKIDKWTEWYESGQKKSEGRYKDLYYDGKWTFWYENGQTRFEGIFKNGYQFGKHTKWYENGQKKSEYFYKEMPEDDKDIPNEGPRYVDDSTPEIDISKYRQNLDLHGTCSDWNEDGQLTSELKYKNGQGWNGFWTEGKWGACDLGISQGQFIKGKKDGRWIVSINPERFDENDNMIYLADHFTILNPYLNNPLWIDEDNRIYGEKFFEEFSKREINYQNGKLHGKMIYWNRKGQIVIESNYKNNLLDGLEIEYENGQISMERNYSKGVQQGKETWWNENGQISHESNYSKGVLQGKNTDWHSNGQKLIEVNYIDGKKDGKDTFWDEDGQKWTEVNYIDGKKDGKSTMWYLSDAMSEAQDNLSQPLLLPIALMPTIKKETHYKNDKKHGTFTKWYVSGLKEEAGNFKDGKKEGHWTSWDKDGQEIATKSYKDGVELKDDIPF